MTEVIKYLRAEEGGWRILFVLALNLPFQSTMFRNLKLSIFNLIEMVSTWAGQLSVLLKSNQLTESARRKNELDAFVVPPGTTPSPQSQTDSVDLSHGHRASITFHIPFNWLPGNMCRVSRSEDTGRDLGSGYRMLQPGSIQINRGLDLE